MIEERSADEILAKAAKKSSGFSSLIASASGKRNDRKEEAAELYKLAGNKYRTSREFAKAAKAFEDAAAVDVRPYDSAATYVDAGNAWHMANNLPKAADCIGKAASIFTKKGPKRRAVQLMVDLADLYGQMNDWKNAQYTWKATVAAAVENNSPALAAKAMLGLAEASMQLKDYHTAVEGFEAAARDATSNKLARWSLKTYYFNAGLCYLASGDLTGCARALEQYAQEDKAFNATPEYRCLRLLLKSLETNNESGVEQALFKYDQQKRLDKTQLELALVIKKQVSSLL